jgi:hypothetical protein
MKSNEKLLAEVKNLIYDLGWDYERMSQSGKGIYNELCDKLGIE